MRVLISSIWSTCIGHRGPRGNRAASGRGVGRPWRRRQAARADALQHGRAGDRRVRHRTRRCASAGSAGRAAACLLHRDAALQPRWVDPFAPELLSAQRCGHQQWRTGDQSRLDAPAADHACAPSAKTTLGAATLKNFEPVGGVLHPPPPARASCTLMPKQLQVRETQPC